MESHVLNTYHQARYRTIGHKILRSSESMSSEGSCHQTSPEHSQSQPEYGRPSTWKLGPEWSRNQNVNITRSQDTDSDEENIEVQDVSFEEPPANILQLEPNGVEENSLIEGDDYDVIQVFAVDPNLDLEASDDEEKTDFSIRNVSKQNPDEYLSTGDNTNKEDSVLTPDVLKLLDAPVVSNVDEYFIKEDKDILAVKDEPIVKDVDEYFIKEKPVVQNDDNFYIDNKQPTSPVETQSNAVNIDEFFVMNAAVPPKVEQENLEVVKETDLEVLPKIEELKRYLLEDMTYSNFKKAQRSCSLPQSPMHNVCLDLDDAKTCLSFEDLNLDLSDLTFDNDKDKTGHSAKSDDNLRTLTEEDVNSFLITNNTESKEVRHFDDLSYQDMEIENPVESIVDAKPAITNSVEHAPKVIPMCIPNDDIPIKTVPTYPGPKSNVLDFCIEKSSAKKERVQVKPEVESEDFVDIESCNDTVIPVLEANNLNSLLEQFEATEKLNKPIRPVIKIEEPKVKTVSLTNGMRLQDAGVQLNKNKMRQILMPSTLNAAVRRSPSPVHSDHDYCSPKKRFSLPNIKGGQSLLKPEVLSSNSRILNSRHRSCKNKKVIYNLSSDDESDKCNAKNKTPDVVDSEKIKKASVKQTVKIVTNPTRKKLSPSRAIPDTYKNKSNNSVIIKDACKASDSPISQSSNGSIKLIIKNKCEVILNCDHKDSQKDKTIEKCKSSSVSEKTVEKVEVIENISKNIKNIKCIKQGDSEKNKNISVENCVSVSTKEEPRSKNENFYTTLFTNKQDVQIPQAMQIKTDKRSFEEELSIVTNKVEIEQPQKKKRLNLQEYKLRRGFSSNASPTTVSPEAIFPEMPASLNLEKATKVITRPQLNGLIKEEQTMTATPKKIFDPIREASRKILMNTKKQKAEAMRKRDEDIVMSKIPKVENLELQPLISDAEMLKIVGMNPAETLPVPIEKPQLPAEYEEIIMVSIGINTDDKVFKEIKKAENSAEKVQNSQSSDDPKSHINFKIKKSDHVLKQNVFQTIKRDKKSPVDDKKHQESKIDKKRYKEITAAMKSVQKQVETKISSNSLFASIQDVVLKKAPDEDDGVSSKNNERTTKKADRSKSSKRQSFKPIKSTIIREYDTKTEHGEDKVILHLEKNRTKPDSAHMNIQTDPDPNEKLSKVSKPEPDKDKSPVHRKRNDSDMSMSSDDTPPVKSDKVKRIERRDVTRSPSKTTRSRSRSRDRYERYRRSRSCSRNRRRRRSHGRSRSRGRSRSHGRSRSRSRGRFRRYRRSDSPYRRKRTSRSYRRRSRSNRRDYRSNRSRSRNAESRSRNAETRSKSPVKKARTPPHSADRKPVHSYTPPPRQPTVSESSSCSSSTSSASSRTSSSSSEESGVSRRSCTRRKDDPRKAFRSPYSSEDRESNTPVEERRIVFVGKLEKDITKTGLRSQFTKFGPVLEVRLHSKEDGSRYGFVTFQRARDAWSAVEAAGGFPQYDVGFGGRRAFCRQSYADLDGLEAKYTESAFHGQPATTARRDENMSFEQMLLEMKRKLCQRKGEKKHDDKA